MLNIYAVGGTNEIGLSQFVFYDKEASFLIDSGIAFAKDSYLGINKLIPDYNQLFNKFPDINKIFITHGHEDHIGSITHLLMEKNIEVFATPYTLSLIKHKCERTANLDFEKLKINTVSTDDEYRVGNFIIKYIYANHSIPDTASIFIKSNEHNILFSSDYKLNGDIDYFKNIKAITKKHGPIDVFFSDSTNAIVEGSSVKEDDLEKSLDEIFKKAKKKIIFTLFSSHIDRINMVLRLCEKNNKKLFLSGLNLNIHINIAKNLSYLEDDSVVVYEQSEYKKVDEDKIVLLCTGSQGEENSSIMKLARDYHPFASINKEDFIIFSSSVIPGNEREILDTINSFIKKGATVYSGDKSIVHTTGHACIEEIKQMINFIKPKYYIPIHGEPIHLRANIDLAKNLGIEEKNCILLNNEKILSFNKSSYKFIDTQKVERFFIDKSTDGILGKDILKERKKVSSVGLVIVNIIKLKDLKYKVSISSYGVLNSNELKIIFKNLEKKIKYLFVTQKRKKNIQEYIKNTVKQEFRYYYKDKPEVLVNFIRT